ncbi:GNAT family N-acetyltransferase [Microlunatus speluncae]|uniref:GNAT family N-acetyltransferase n=1 Tax=Microlunatus speluncae TaxID=2594267 RepID=UPI001266392D|nr:GNAT family N-acetyltransferase [Microlunatus speluncae]
MITEAQRRTEIRPVAPADDAPLVRRWLTGPRAAFWRMGHLEVDQVRDYLAGIVADPDQAAWLGSVDGGPAFLAETYDPARVLLAGRYSALPGDLGMHVLIAPPDGPSSHGFTGAVFAAVMRWCFDRLGAERVVVEPDVANTKIIAMNARAGFRVLDELELPEGDGTKQAALSACTRADFASSVLGRNS